ncbi:MAG: MFS transporter [Deltaproteobacteria bacterium]|nr:MFS transporter [Deltaproteobacteria bacterium]
MNLSPMVVLLLCGAVVMMTSIGVSSFSLFLPAIEAEFGWSRAMATVPYMVAMLGWGAGAVLFGKLADDFGARRVVLGGILLMAAGFLGMGLSQNLWQLSVSYGVMVGMALGACGLTIMSLLVSKRFDARTRGLAVSVIQTAPPLTPLIFAPILFFLIVTFSWRIAALAASALLFFVALPLAWLGASDPDVARGERPGRMGWASCLPYLRNRSMLFLFAARFSCGVAFFQIAHLVGLTMSKGFDLAAGARSVSVFGAAAAASALLFGWLSDRYGRGQILALSYFVRGVGTLLLAVEIPSELLFYGVVALAIGPTFGTVAIQNVMYYEIAGPRMAGVILGLSFIIHQIGSAGGPMIASIAFDLTGSYDEFMVVMGVILVASGLLVSRIKDPDGQLPQPALLTTASQA